MDHEITNVAAIKAAPPAAARTRGPARTTAAGNCRGWCTRAAQHPGSCSRAPRQKVHCVLPQTRR